MRYSYEMTGEGAEILDEDGDVIALMFTADDAKLLLPYLEEGGQRFRTDKLQTDPDDTEQRTEFILTDDMGAYFYLPTFTDASTLREHLNRDP